MSHSLTSALARLRNSDGRVAGSVLTRDQRSALNDFARKTGCVQQAVSGRGVVYRIVNEKAFETHYRQLRPMEMEELPQDLPQRALNIASSRSSKGSVHIHDTYYLLLKSTGAGVSWSNGRSTLDLTAASKNCGAATLAITDGDEWASEQPLWLVENQKLFDRLDWLPSDTVASIVYYGGQLSNLLINWLARTSRAKEVILFPDYDGIGFLNYARLRAKLGSNCHFWLMSEWERLLSEFGNNRVWLDTFADFESAHYRLQGGVKPELQQLMKEMQKQALALEQEAIWLSNDFQKGSCV